MTHRFISHEANRALGTEVIERALISDEQKLADIPLLVSYDVNDLRNREIAYVQDQEARRATLIALERKTIADSMRDRSRLTGSDLPADADPRQLHLF